MAKGTKTGGRQKGTPNKATAAKAAELAESGLLPLDFMMAAMRDETKDFEVRLDAAKSAAPYVHPRLAAIEHTGKDGGPIQTEELAPNDRARKIAFLLQQGIAAQKLDS